MCTSFIIYHIWVFLVNLSLFLSMADLNSTTFITWLLCFVSILSHHSVLFIEGIIVFTVFPHVVCLLFLIFFWCLEKFTFFWMVSLYTNIFFLIIWSFFLLPSAIWFVSFKWHLFISFKQYLLTPFYYLFTKLLILFSFSDVWEVLWNGF